MAAGTSPEDRGRRVAGLGSRGQAGGGCGLASGENEAQYLAAQQVAQPTAGTLGAGAFSSEAWVVERNIIEAGSILIKRQVRASNVWLTSKGKPAHE